MPKGKPRPPLKTELRHLVHELAGVFLLGMLFLYARKVWCASIACVKEGSAVSQQPKVLY